MIIGTVTLLMLLLGGGGNFSFEKAFTPFAKEAVKDKARYEQIVELTKQGDEGVKQFRKEVGDVWAVEMKALLTDFDTNEEDFRDFREKADQSRTSVQQKLLDVRFDVAKLMTEEEWNAMYKAMDEKVGKDKK